MWVVVGLGNPGREYAETRHNVGYMVVDELLRRSRIRAARAPGDYLAATLRLGEHETLLVKPTTYVNRTGRAVQQVAAQHGVPPDRLLAVVDDVALPFGRLRLRPSGGPGGHNGLRSMIDALGTEAFPRLRLGVGAPEEAAIPLADWVLGPFAPEERAALPELVDRAAAAVLRVIEVGVESAVPEVNAPPPPPPPGPG